ncbi:lysozyme [Polyangium mundeleinium]|uniref:Lysozyme n=1 Tax=Polyangium mundeleinium TaxID=2995306 RepID=A0ABT5ETE0_9BACT|nr:lysozyme [Polyangium mundeleinium]MDC0744055.1 lysozyme [Polyangium mundeleinium]
MISWAGTTGEGTRVLSTAMSLLGTRSEGTSVLTVTREQTSPVTLVLASPFILDDAELDALFAETPQEAPGVPLTQAQFDALVSFTFNVGAGWMKKSQLRRALLRRQYGDVPRAMSLWVYAGGKKLRGLVRRRLAEGRPFKHGKYT